MSAPVATQSSNAGPITGPIQTGNTPAVAANVVPNVPDQRAGGPDAVLADLATERDKRQAAQALAATQEGQLAELQAKIQEFERAGMKDIEKVTAERDDFSTKLTKISEERDSAVGELARIRAAYAAGLTEGDISDLRTDGTEEEWAERVKRTAERLGVTPPGVAPKSPARPARGLPPSPTASREGNPGSSSTSAGAAAYAARHKKPGA